MEGAVATSKPCLFVWENAIYCLVNPIVYQPFHKFVWNAEETNWTVAGGFLWGLVWI